MKRPSSRSVAALALVLASAIPQGQVRAPRTHRIEATPATVVYGYYWSEAKPIVHSDSGDSFPRRVGWSFGLWTFEFVCDLVLGAWTLTTLKTWELFFVRS